MNKLGWPSNNQSKNLHLKSENDFQNIFYDAQFKKVTAEIVDPFQNTKNDNDSKYKFHSGKKKHNNETSSAIKNPKVSKVSHKPDQERESGSELHKELQQLKKELAEVKQLALDNKESLNSLRPMPRAYANTNYSNNQKNQINGVSISQAELHYLRYGSSKSNLDILA